MNFRNAAWLDGGGKEIEFLKVTEAEEEEYYSSPASSFVSAALSDS